MNVFETGVIETIGLPAFEKIQQVHVGIAGAGGLGSNCALLLVRCGFKKLTLADFDVVSPSNLNRQYYFPHQVGKPKVDMLKENLLLVNPDLEIHLKNEKLTHANLAEAFRECHVIVEAFDSPQAKKQLVEGFLFSEKLIVSASGISGWGNSDSLQTHPVRANFFVVGDLATPADALYPPMSPRVTIVAAKQADIVLTHVIGHSQTMKQKEAPLEPPVFS